MCSVKHDTMSAEVDETQIHLEPVLLETLDLAR